MTPRIAKIMNLSLKSVLILGTLAQSTVLLAQYNGDSVMGDTDQYLDNNSGTPYQSEQIDVDGRYDRLDKMRRNLEKKNQQMVRKKIEDVRMKNESRLTKQLQGAFSGHGFPAASNQVSAKYSPVVKHLENTALGTRMMVNLGAMAFSGTEEEIESKSAVSLGLEGDVSTRFSFGINVNYTSADLVDDANIYVNSQNFNNNYNTYNNFNPYNTYNPYNSNNYYGSGYSSIYGQGREMSYSRVGIEVQGKFFFTRTKRFAPYFGGALSINRSKLSYDNNEEYNYNGSSFGNEMYKSNSFAAAAMLGAEVKFTKMFGAMAEVKGGKGFGTFGQSENKTNYRSLDEIRLENLGEDLEQALYLGASLGLFVQF